MADAKELRAWSLTLKHWAEKIDDTLTSEQARRLAAELLQLARCKEAAERQFV